MPTTTTKKKFMHLNYALIFILYIWRNRLQENAAVGPHRSLRTAQASLPASTVPASANCPRSLALQPPSCTQSGESRCATLVSSMIDLIPYEEQGLTRPPSGGRSGEGWGGSRWLWGGQGQVLRPAPCGGLQRHFLNSSNYTALINPNSGSIGAILWPACILP